MNYINVSDNYESFRDNDINNLGNLHYDFVLADRFVHVTDNEGKSFSCQTPFLKILKPIHSTLNKKKTIAKNYIILETNDDLDFNNQISDFMYIINKIHEVSQEKIRENSITWFNTEFDDIGLDIKVRRPIDQQRNSEFIKISIPYNLEEDVKLLEKGDYVLCNIIFKGLRISNDYIYEEWELESIITQENFDKQINSEESSDVIQNMITLTEPEELLENKELIKEMGEPNTEFDVKVIDIKDNSTNEIPYDDNVSTSASESNEEKKVIKLERTTDISKMTDVNDFEMMAKKPIKKSTTIKINKGSKKDLIKKLSKKIIFN